MLFRHWTNKPTRLPAVGRAELSGHLRPRWTSFAAACIASSPRLSPAYHVRSSSSRGDRAGHLMEASASLAPRLLGLADSVPRIVLLVRQIAQRRIVSLLVGFHLWAPGVQFVTCGRSSLPDLGSRISTRGHTSPWTLLRLRGCGQRRQRQRCD